SDWDEDTRDEKVKAALVERGLTGWAVSYFPIHSQETVEFMRDRDLGELLDRIAKNPGPRIGTE
ncbi:hypothetical protein P1J78_24215, partial [Psychromarinibacter sp. C21-152]